MNTFSSSIKHRARAQNFQPNRAEPIYDSSAIPADRTAALSKLTIREQPCAAASCVIRASAKPAFAPSPAFMN
ncbi:hypothetical protein [Polaromonas glacialis]|uniref:hypothetical protein n=1 Tax=Polaromonas glacialis TaxID=866564 RepID=UPI0018DD82CA|nr:hypothetical protein [Polaromonas glacialis]